MSLLLASACGCNLGDFLPDIYHLSPMASLLVWAASFGLIYNLRTVPYLTFWLSVLIVRAAATETSDLFVRVGQLGYVVTGIALSMAFSLLVFKSLGSTPPINCAATARRHIGFWITMLSAGALGTVLADGIAHAVYPTATGVLLSASITTVAIAGQFYVRRLIKQQSAITYWVLVLLIRVWGTSVGDIAAYVFSLPRSTAISLALLCVVLSASKCLPMKGVTVSQTLLTYSSRHRRPGLRDHVESSTRSASTVPGTS